MSPPLAALLEAEGLKAACAAKLAAAGVETIDDLVQLSETELKADVGLALMHAKKLAKAAKAKAKAAAKAKAEAEAKAQKERAAAAEAEAAARRQRQAAAAAEEASATKKKELSAEEQKKQNVALYDAARWGEMGKFKAAIAAGAEVDWHNPNQVSELSELE